MPTFNIEVPKIPAGYVGVAYRQPHNKDELILKNEQVCKAAGHMNYEWLIVEKTKPRRIVLEETVNIMQENAPQSLSTEIGIITIYHSKQLRAIKEGE